jgi:Zn-dependent peptidase ImmA (M78 family)
MTGINSSGQSPAEILMELGIREPGDLDIEAIAQHCGATIQYKPLAGCAARIMGLDDAAIITIDVNSSAERRRFSGGHELGHWMRDRGTASFRCDEQVFVREWSVDNPEKRANRFASDLLLPAKMFRPLSEGLPMTFASVQQLADVFKMSLSATAIRLVEYGSYPAMLVCNSAVGREWYVASSTIEKRLWPVDRLDQVTQAAALLNRRAQATGPQDVRADHWIKNFRADRYWIKEDSILWTNQSVLSLIWWEDESQLIDLDNFEEETGSWRSDQKRNWD